MGNGKREWEWEWAWAKGKMENEQMGKEGWGMSKREKNKWPIGEKGVE
jgi:hypothetical protein